MNTGLVIQMIGGAGFLAGVTALLHFANTWKSTKSKSSADAMQAYRAFVSSAFDDQVKVHQRVAADRDRLSGVRDSLIDLVQDVVRLARAKGATDCEVEPFRDRLDALRRK